MQWEPLDLLIDRKAMRVRLREALMDYLETHGGKAKAIKAVSFVADTQWVTRAYVTAAMWSLVDDELIKYTRKAKLKIII